MSDHFGHATSRQLVDPEEYTWEHVARDRNGWHPALQPHIERLLSVHGPGSMVSPEAIHFPPVDDPLPSEALPIPEAAAETARPEAIQIKQAFTTEFKALCAAGIEPEFDAFCMEQSVDPYDDVEKPSYWRAVADYNNERMTKAGEEAGQDLGFRTRELLAEAPNYMFEQFALSRGTHGSEQHRQHARSIASYFNGLVRDYAKDFPATQFNDMHTGLLNSVNRAFTNKAERQAAAQELERTLIGARHELMFGQILSHTDRPYRPANQQEDLQGVDYVVYDGNRELSIDVKSSLSQIEARGGERNLFARKPDGHLIMFSLVTHEDVKNQRALGEQYGTFFLSDSAAAQKAVYLDQVLSQAAHGWDVA